MKIFVLWRCDSYWMISLSVDATLDPDTAHPYLILSDDGKQERHGDIEHELPNNPERFDNCVSVLGKEGFSSGKFYFEVLVRGKTEWNLGVARESINRKGLISAWPQYGFWTVALWNENDYRAHDPSVSLSLRVKPQKVGYLWIMRRVWSPSMMWSPDLISTFSLVSLSLRNSILYSALVVMMKVKIQPHWSFHLLNTMHEFTPQIYNGNTVL